MQKSKTTCIAQIIIPLLLTISCSQPKANKTEITISAAASLKNVMEEVKLLYQQQLPQTNIIYNFAASGTLQRQIEQGAEIDIYISASPANMDALEKQNLLVANSRQDLLKNQMVLIVPKEQNSTEITNFTDLTKPESNIIALGQPKSVPAGKYAQEILAFFNITDQVNSKAVYGKNVRQVLNYVATGNADAGIVYRTDAQVESNITVIAIAPENSHSPVIYPLAIIKDSKNIDAAKTFISFLTTPQAQKIFTEYGFITVNSESQS